MRVLAVILVFVAAVLTALLVMNSDEKVLRTVPASSNAAVDGVTLAKPVTVAFRRKGLPGQTKRPENLFQELFRYLKRQSQNYRPPKMPSA